MLKFGKNKEKNTNFIKESISSKIFFLFFRGLIIVVLFTIIFFEAWYCFTFYLNSVVNIKNNFSNDNNKSSSVVNSLFNVDANNIEMNSDASYPQAVAEPEVNNNASTSESVDNKNNDVMVLDNNPAIPGNLSNNSSRDFVTPPVVGSNRNGNDVSLINEPETSSSIPASNPQLNQNKPNETNQVQAYAGNYQLGSFGYAASNIDKNKTSLYFDDKLKAITFPADFSWQSATNNEINSFSVSSYTNNLMGPYFDRRCIANNCLEQKGNDLYYNGKALLLPSGISSSDISAVSIATLSNRWLVGFTLKSGSNYYGKVFSFHGGSFFAINLPTNFSSEYFGLFGFGGEDSDFLVIYGSYCGTAYRVRDGQFTDISDFFGCRLINKAFKAEVIKNSYNNNINWYIYSSTNGYPYFIKLWQNHSSEITGEMSYKLFSGMEQSASFKLIEANSQQLKFVAKIIDGSSNPVWKVFIDRGFKNSGNGSLVTNPWSEGNTNIIIKNILESNLVAGDKDRSSVKFLFSTDSQNWQSLKLGTNLDFTSPSLSSYYLKLNFPAQSDKFYSPFISSIIFNYAYQKVD